MALFLVHPSSLWSTVLSSHAGTQEIEKLEVLEVLPSFPSLSKFSVFLRNEALDLTESYSEQIGEKMWMELLFFFLINLKIVHLKVP